MVSSFKKFTFDCLLCTYRTGISTALSYILAITMPKLAFIPFFSSFPWFIAQITQKIQLFIPALSEDYTVSNKKQQHNCQKNSEKCVTWHAVVNWQSFVIFVIFHLSPYPFCVIIIGNCYWDYFLHWNFKFFSLKQLQKGVFVWSIWKTFVSPLSGM